MPTVREKNRDPKYEGRLIHDFRKSAANELWRAGNSKEDCMKVTGHRTMGMFDRYADLFSEEEQRQIMRDVQSTRREWRNSLPGNVVQIPKCAM